MRGWKEKFQVGGTHKEFVHGSGPKYDVFVCSVYRVDIVELCSIKWDVFQRERTMYVELFNSDTLGRCEDDLTALSLAGKYCFCVVLYMLVPKISESGRISKTFSWEISEKDCFCHKFFSIFKLYFWNTELQNKTEKCKTVLLKFTQRLNYV